MRFLDSFDILRQTRVPGVTFVAKRGRSDHPTGSFKYLSTFLITDGQVVARFLRLFQNVKFTKYISFPRVLRTFKTRHSNVEH